MTDFCDLNTLYSYLEDHAQDFPSAIEIRQLFENLGSILKTSGNEIDLEIAKWESEFFFFRMVNGKIQPFAQMNGEMGDCYDFPDLRKIDERQWSYLAGRLNVVKNPVIKARYAHILWSSQKRHGKYAQTAIDNYLLLTRIYEEKDKENTQKHFGLCVLESIKQAYSLAITINKYRFDTIKTEILRLVTSYSPESSSCPALRTQLLKLIFEDKKNFSTDDLAGFLTLCEEIADLWISRDNVRPAIDVYEFAERYEMRTSGNNTGKWRRKIAECYETMMHHRLERGDIGSALIFCADAIRNYQKIKETEKVKELALIYQQNKDKIEYKEFSQEIDLTDHVQNCKDFARDLVKNNSSEQIIGFLAADEEFILPKMQTVINRAKEISGSSLVHQIATISATDQQNNPAQVFSTEKERFNHCVLEQYRRELEARNRTLIKEIMFQAVRDGKLTYSSIIEFLQKNSWAGKTYSKKIGNVEISYSWITLVSPAIDDYLTQLKSYLDDDKNVPSLILCIDSLTIKIEGLLRDFIALKGISTSTFKREDVVREKDLNELLADPILQELFSEEELIFFKFLLVEQTGYNLRNKVAHSFMIPQEYRIDLMNYLIIAMLRICKYNFTIKTSEE